MKRWQRDFDSAQSPRYMVVEQSRNYPSTSLSVRGWWLSRTTSRTSSEVEMKSKPRRCTMNGYMYILLCSNGQYYTGSTNDLERRLAQHQNGEGANFTKKHLPVKLVYYEEYERIDEAFYREKQVQGWSRKKKEALIAGKSNLLHELAECKNETHFRNAPASVSSISSAERSRSGRETSGS